MNCVLEKRHAPYFGEEEIFARAILFKEHFEMQMVSITRVALTTNFRHRLARLDAHASGRQRLTIMGIDGIQIRAVLNDHSVFSAAHVFSLHPKLSHVHDTPTCDGNNCGAIFGSDIEARVHSARGIIIAHSKWPNNLARARHGPLKHCFGQQRDASCAARFHFAWITALGKFRRARRLKLAQTNLLKERAADIDGHIRFGMADSLLLEMNIARLPEE